MAVRHARNGQAMIETVIAVLVIAFMFFFLFRLSRVLTGKILVQHAAMRVARARAVGMNDFMCLKSARLAVLPVSGERIRPADKGFTVAMERARFANYLMAPYPGIAAAVLDYEGWKHLEVDAGDGTKSSVRLRTGWMDQDDFKWFGFDLKGKAGIEHNYPLYLNGAGR